MRFLSKNLHHAYLIEGEENTIFSSILDFLEKELNFKTKTNPDFFEEKYDILGIEETRRIKEIQSKKAFGERKVFILRVNSATREAQNSLLKMFEEPTEHTHFFVITRSFDIFLSTLQSRMERIKEETSEDSSINVSDFLKANKTKRLDLIKDVIKNKDKETAIKFLDELERVLRKEIKFDNLDKNLILSLNEISKCKKYLNTRSPSLKLILEHMALIVDKY